MNNSSIEWTDATWNPVSGCSHVSEGCRNCYAEAIAKRFSGKNGFPEFKPWSAQNSAHNVVLHPERLDQPLRWKRPRRIFVNSMSDLFHEAIPMQFIDEVFSVMAICKHHVFQVLTKRPQRMRRYVQTAYKDAEYIHAIYSNHQNTTRLPLPNVWLGVSCEDQKTANERIPLLLRTPAAIRFVSFEPLLEEIKLHRGHNYCPEHDSLSGMCLQYHEGVRCIDWAIIGGESGPKARPTCLDDIESLLRQCLDANIVCFVKQIGSKPYQLVDALDYDYGVQDYEIKNRKGGDPSEWPSNLRVREYPK